MQKFTSSGRKLWYLFLLIPFRVIASGEGPALLDAAQDGKIAEVRQLLAKGVDVDYANDFGNNAIMLAASWGHNDIVTLLLEAGANVNHCSKDHKSTLMVAMQKSEDPLSLVRMLILAGADVDYKTPFGWTALMEAAIHYGHSDMCRELFLRGASVPTWKGWWNAEMWEIKGVDRNDEMHRGRQTMAGAASAAEQRVKMVWTCLISRALPERQIRLIGQLGGFSIAQKALPEQFLRRRN